MASKIMEDLNWRYATKKFDPDKRISDSDFDELLEALRLTPSSYGLQPWKFVVVSDKNLRRKLLEYSGRQRQVVDASHLIVLCVNRNIDEKYIRNYVKLAAETRGFGRDSQESYAQSLMASIRRKSGEALLEWARRQVYIALGTLLTVAAAKRIDACPMEGFKHEKFDEILGLEEMDLSSVVLCPVGYRGDDDNATKKKVRFGKKDLFVFK